MALLEGLGVAFKKLDCAILGSAGYLAGGVSRFTGLDQGLAENAVNALRRLRGCPETGDYQSPQPEFTGGQCSALYNVTFNWTNDQGIRQSNTQQPSGPILGTFRDPANNFQRTPIGILLGSPDGTTTSKLVVTSVSVGTEPASTLGPISRVDGNPDDCGDPPPPPLPPPSNINFDVNVTFQDGNDNIINITIPVEFKPFTVNFNGDVSFPFDFNLGGINFNGDVKFAPDFSLTLNPPRLPPGPINPPPSGSEPSTTEPLAPRGSKIQGVIVIATVTSQQEVSSYEGSPVPDIYVPRLGSVKFAYSFGVSTIWSNDIDVKGTAVFIPCPFSQGADAVQARPQPGVTFSLSAVEGPPLATVADLT